MIKRIQLSEMECTFFSVDDMDVPPSVVPPPLSAGYGRHRILEIDQTVLRQLILLLHPEHPPLVQRKVILKVNLTLITRTKVPAVKITKIDLF